MKMQNQQLILTSSEIEASLEAINKFMEKFNRVMNKGNNLQTRVCYDNLKTQTDQIQFNADDHPLTRSRKINLIHKHKNKLSTVEEESILATEKESISPISKYQNEQRLPAMEIQNQKVFIIDDLNQHNLSNMKKQNRNSYFLQNSQSKSRQKSSSMKKILNLKNNMKSETLRQSGEQVITISPFEREEDRKNGKRIVKIKAKTKRDQFNNENSHYLTVNKLQKIQKMYTQQSKGCNQQPMDDNFKNKTLKKPNVNTQKNRAILKQCISRRRVNLMDGNQINERKKGLQVIRTPHVYASVDEKRTKQVSIDKIRSKFNQYKKESPNQNESLSKKSQIHINVIQTISNKMSRNSSQHYEKAPLKIVRDHNPLKLDKKANHRISETVCRSIVINR